MIWNTEIEEISKDRVFKFRILAEGRCLLFAEAIAYLTSSKEFRGFLTDELVQVKFDGFFWEVKPISKNRIDDTFEFVVVQARRINDFEADAVTFKEYFKKDVLVTTFKNLRGDAQLVVPVNVSTECNYAHFASFLRTGLPEQIDAFWELVGKEYTKQLSDKPIWLSTAGLGVHWLHVRFDQRPKYYRFEEYQKF